MSSNEPSLVCMCKSLCVWIHDLYKNGTPNKRGNNALQFDDITRHHIAEHTVCEL